MAPVEPTGTEPVSASAAPLTVEQMDEAVSKHLREKHAPSQPRRKSADR